MNIKKNDNIIITKGKDHGKNGKIEKVLIAKNKAIVTGLNKSKKHLKPTQKNPQGGIIDLDQPINIANLMIVCPSCNKPTRVNFKLVNDKKIRICNKCKQTLDQQ